VKRGHDGPSPLEYGEIAAARVTGICYAAHVAREE
jgi:hypothetical protein